MPHHSVMTSSLYIKIFKIDKFGDFSCDIDYNSRTEVFSGAISLIINQCDPRRLRRTQSVFSRARKQVKCACKHNIQKLY